MSDLLERTADREMPWVDVPICLKLNLLTQRDAAMAELARLHRQTIADDRMAGAPNVQAVSDKVAELEQQIREASIVVRITGVDRKKYNTFLLANPPRKGKQETFNPATFFMYVAERTSKYVDKAGTVHEISDEEWKAIDDLLTDGEHDRIAQAVIEVNREVGSADLGFLSPGSETIRDSFGISASLGASASRPAGSGGGSPRRSKKSASETTGAAES